MTELYVITGKGGVGKSTCSAATAIYHAKKGKRVLLASSDPAHNLSDLFMQRFSGEITSVTSLPSLHVLELDAVAEGIRFMEKLSKGISESMSAGFGLKNVDIFKDLTLPGMDEGVAMIELRRHVSSGEWDIVVFDTAPTGHTLRALTIPDVMDGWLRRVLAFKRKIRAIRSILFRQKEDSFEDLVLKVQEELRGMKEVLRASTSHIILVSIPEDLSILETARTISFLNRIGLSAEGIILNRVIPDFEGEWTVDSVIIKMVHQQFLDQQQSLKLARKLFGQMSVKQIPLVAYKPVGVDALLDFSHLLWGP